MHDFISCVPAYLWLLPNRCRARARTILFVPRTMYILWYTQPMLCSYQCQIAPETLDQKRRADSEQNGTYQYDTEKSVHSIARSMILPKWPLGTTDRDSRQTGLLADCGSKRTFDPNKFYLSNNTGQDGADSRPFPLQTSLSQLLRGDIPLNQKLENLKRLRCSSVWSGQLWTVFLS